MHTAAWQTAWHDCKYYYYHALVWTFWLCGFGLLNALRCVHLAGLEAFFYMYRRRRRPGRSWFSALNLKPLLYPRSSIGVRQKLTSLSEVTLKTAWKLAKKKLENNMQTCEPRSRPIRRTNNNGGPQQSCGGRLKEAIDVSEIWISYSKPCIWRLVKKIKSDQEEENQLSRQARDRCPK